MSAISNGSYERESSCCCPNESRVRTRRKPRFASRDLRVTRINKVPNGVTMTTLKNLPSCSRRAALGILVAVSLAGCATQAVSPAEPEKLVSDAQTTLSNFIRDPDQTWIQENLSRAKAVMIAPQIVKAGFIFGGSGGRAVLVARDGRTWAGPAFYDLGDGQCRLSGGGRSLRGDHRRHDGQGIEFPAGQLIQDGGRRKHCGGTGRRRGQVERDGGPDHVHSSEGPVRRPQPRRHGREYQYARGTTPITAGATCCRRTS